VNPFRYGPFLLLSGYTLVGIFTLYAQAGSDEKLASISGVVSNQATGEGLRKAYLRLEQQGAKPRHGYAAVTDDHGGFTIYNVAPGNYYLSAEHIGFLDAQYPGGASVGQAVLLRLTAGDKLTGIEIKLLPQAVLSGKVLDSDGDPWQHGYVILFRSVWQNGRRTMASPESSGVDDRGEFRIGGLMPGRYYVLAESQAGFEDMYHPDVNGKPTPRHQPTWYPSSPDIDSAIPITLAAGQQLTGVDIRLREGSGSRLFIRGKASGISGVVRPQDILQIWARKRSTIDATGPASGSIQRDGSFEIKSVSSGTYEVAITNGFPGWTVLGQTTVQVNESSVEDASIELHAPQTLHANVRIEGDGPTPDFQASLESLDLRATVTFSRKAGDGGLDFYDVGLGQYRVNDPSSRSQVYLKSVRYGNAESNDGTFTLASYGIPLELVFSTRGAKLSGSVFSKNTPTAKDTPTPPRVVLIPDTSDASFREYWTRSAVFDQSSAFLIEGIAPGKYRLYAFEKVPEDIWLADEFLKEVEGSGVGYEAAEGSTSAVQVPLLSKAETDQVLAKIGID
jgi:hypothetical protein